MNLQSLYGLIGATLLSSACAALAPGEGPHAAAPGASAGGYVSITPAATPAMVVEAFEAAIVKGDEAAAKLLLAPDVLIYESGGQESSRDEYAAHHMKGDMAFLAGSKREVLSRAEGGDDRHAWVSTRSRITGRHKDKDIDVFSTETLMLKNTPQGWRIVHIHWSSQPAQRKAP